MPNYFGFYGSDKEYIEINPGNNRIEIVSVLFELGPALPLLFYPFSFL